MTLGTTLTIGIGLLLGWRLGTVLRRAWRAWAQAEAEAERQRGRMIKAASQVPPPAAPGFDRRRVGR